MRNKKTAERIAVEITQPLAQACACLAPHFRSIETSWRKMLKHYEHCDRHASALAGLHFSQRIRDFHDIGTDRYCQESEQQGHHLARRGVPVECIGVALLLYVECCLPHLAPEDPRVVRSLQAVLSWSRVYLFFLLTGYARQSASDLQAMDDRVNAAERRYQESSVKLGDAYEEERRRLARDLHDEIGHDLIVLKLYTQIISMDLKKGDLVQVRIKLKESVSLVKHVLGGVRNLVFDLGPTVWNEQGFIPAVRLHARQFAARTGIHVRFETRRLRTKLPARYESTLYRVLQGALANIAAHAGAKYVKIRLAILGNCFVLEIEDDGKGFNLEGKMRSVSRSYGLRAMRDRIELLGGKIQFTSRRAQPGAGHSGTTVQCSLPVIESEKE
jgi:signal transduction histidine kinase